MSLKFIKHFVYLGVSYDIYYDTGTNAGVVNASGGTPLTTIPLPNGGDSANPGDFITDFCSDNPNTTKVTATAKTTTPFADFALDADSADCPLIPDTGSCDISINSVSRTNEMSTGANDGTATINASSSAGGLTYSLDNITFQSGSTFSSLAPGNYTAYAKDDNDCIISQPFSIIAFNNPVQNFSDDLPTVTIPAANVSKWNAAFNPIVIFFQRKDFNVVSITQLNDTQIVVEIDTSLPFYQQQLAINDVLYFKTAKYEFYGKADAYNVSGGHGLITVTEIYTEDDTSGFMNINGIKPGYYIDVKIQYGLDPVRPKFINPQFSPSNKGSVRADLAPFLQTLLDFKDNYNYVDQNWCDLSQAASYQVTFRELWTSGNGEWFSAPYPLYVTRAAHQLGERYNGNMAAYVPFSNVTSPEDKAKFLTDFKQPVYWQGLPSDISFIFSDDLVNKQLYLQLTPDCGSSSGDVLLANADAGLLTDVDTSRFIIARTDISSIPVIEALGVNRLLIPDVFDCCATQIVANIYYLDGETKVYVMQPLTIRAKCVCTEPYVYIKWVNSRGAWDYYYFGFNQYLSANVTNDQAVQRFVLNWETSDTIEDAISKSSIRSLKVGADNITEDDASALQWARKSVKAMMLINTNPVKWQTVIIKDGATDTIQTKKKTSNVAFELILPSDNVQNQ